MAVKNYKQNIILFENLPDMTPVEITLPDAPRASKIQGHNLPQKEQKWRRTTFPGGHLKNFKKKPREERELFIAQEWDRRKNGHFFMNNGEVIYLTGLHYWFLNYIQLPSKTGYPDYRNTDAEFFYHWQKADNDPTCFGLIELTGRQGGKSSRAGCIILEYCTGHSQAIGGIQSKTFMDSKKLFQKAVVQPWRKLPYFFQPTFDNPTFPKTELRFFYPSEKGKEGRAHLDETQVELQSFIDCQTSTENAYDGQTMHIYIGDEEGKCFAKDTPVLMYDGSAKMIQDIVVGDEVMGDDSTARKVLGLGRGKEMMYDIVPTKGMTWGCNESHILSLRWCSSRPDFGWSKDQVINISLDKYLSLSKRTQKHLVGWRVKSKDKTNPLRFKFEVIKKEVGDYYGIVLDGNRLFCLADNTVVHNTVEVNVYDRWEVVKKALEIRDHIRGKALHTSTVEEMEKMGGRNYKNIWDESDPGERTERGRTKSGLWRHFLPAYRAFKYDEYGNAMEEVGRAELEKERRAHINNPNKLASEKRKNPFTVREAFRTDAKDCNFNAEIIQNRMDEFVMGNPLKVGGRFQWHNGEVDTFVEWVPTSKEQAKFQVSMVLDQRYANKFIIDRGIRTPGNATRFVAGGDPFRFSKTKNAKKSNGAGAVFWMRDSTIDHPGKNTSEWESNRFVCTYKHRPRTKDEYGEDMIMMCHYFGCKMFPEINVDFLLEYFEKRGYGGYLLYKRDKHTGRLEKNAGETTSRPLKEEIYREVESHIELHGAREVHDEWLEECLEIEDEMNDYDLFVACGYALLGAKSNIAGPATEKKQAASFVRRFTYKK